jgi:hypothetical protein
MLRCFAGFRRPVNALFALWFAIVLGDPGVLHACPMHGGAHGAGHSAAAGHTAAGPDGHAAHGAAMAGVAEESAPQTAHHGDTPAPCTCVGHCCAAPAAAPLPLLATVLVVETAAEVRRPPVAPVDEPPAAPALRLPFANGPPAA